MVHPINGEEFMSRIRKVLIIDDEHDILEMLGLRLMSEGFDVTSAYDGLRGVESVKKDKPDAIILDLIMPVMDGWEVCEKLKSDESTKDIPIILATAAVSNDLEEKANRVGIVRVLKKPFDEKELIQFLRDF